MAWEYETREEPSYALIISSAQVGGGGNLPQCDGQLASVMITGRILVDSVAVQSDEISGSEVRVSRTQGLATNAMHSMLVKTVSWR